MAVTDERRHGQGASGTNDFCPAAGTDYYYASLYYPLPQRRRIQLLEALRRELSVIPEVCRDRGVAHTKLAWWHDELDHLERGTPRHQLSRCLAPYFHSEPGLSNCFRDFIVALHSSLSDVVPPTRDAVLDEIAAVHGGVIRALAETSPRQNEADYGQLRRLAVLVELAYDLRGLRQHRQSATLHLSAGALAAHGLTANVVRDTPTSKPLEALLKAELTELRSEIAATLDQMPKHLRNQQRLFTTLARIQLHAVKLTLEDGCQVLERRIDPTPVHKLMLALRTRLFG